MRYIHFLCHTGYQLVGERDCYLGEDRFSDFAMSYMESRSVVCGTGPPAESFEVVAKETGDEMVFGITR